MSGIAELQHQHRLEEVCEHFGLGLDTDEAGNSFLSFSRLSHVRSEGLELIPSLARRFAEAATLECTEEGVLLPFSGLGEIALLEDRLLAFLQSLLEEDPAAFLKRPETGIDIPTSNEFLESKRWLDRFYGQDFIPKEKKPVVVDLRGSQGPYLRSVDSPPLQILDAASQISSLPAGFRADYVQSALDEGSFDEHLTAALETGNSERCAVAREYADELLSFAPPGLTHVTFVNGGAEANEKAFDLARRHGQGGRRILAFEGSFHGRTLLSLFSTWNPVKREPYQLTGFETQFVPFPESEIDDDPPIPAGWREAWSNPEGARENFGEGNALLAAEVMSLKAAEAVFAAGDMLATIIEPYQCEGGDRCATPRFFHGLRALTRAYNVPLIFDEVQTGMGLSGPIFWHRRFWLVDAEGRPDGPDLLTCAKRAQVGVVLSRWADSLPSHSHSASLLRGRIHLDIVHPPVMHEEYVRAKLVELAQRWPEGLITRPRGIGDAFAFDLPGREIANHLIGQRFYRGYMVYIAGERTLRYRLNRSMNVDDIHLLFQIIDESLHALIEQAGGLGPGLFDRMSACTPPPWVSGPEPLTRPGSPSLPAMLTRPGPDLADQVLKEVGDLSDSVRSLGMKCLGLSQGSRGQEAVEALRKASPDQFAAQAGVSLDRFAADLLGTRIRRITAAELRSMSAEIEALEADAYESSRRDPLSYLCTIAESCGSIILIAEEPDGLVGMSFGAPLELWWAVDGPRQDPNLHRRNTLYSADITVARRGRGRGIGNRLRERSIQEALREKGADGGPRYAFISGRNRVGEADAMWALNRRFGAYEVATYSSQYGEEGGRSRYYRIPLRRHDRRHFAPKANENRPLDMSCGVFMPTGAAHPLLLRARDLGVFDEGALTKLTVSNFITRPYARYVEMLRELAPQGCPHLYLTSSLSEMVDKSIRALKHKRVDAQVAVGLRGGYFGHATAAARSLSDWGKDQATEGFFDWPLVPHPSEDPEGCIAALDAIVAREGADKVLGLYVEAVQGRTGAFITEQAWSLLCEWRDSSGIPLVLSERTTGRYRSGKGMWWCDAMTGNPDLVLWWGGGQIGHIFSSDETYVAKPLTLISTWDGDELSATRSLWQLYACSEARVADRAAQLEAGLRAAGLDDNTLGGMGLYRLIKAAPAVLDRMELRASQAGIHLSRTRYGWLVVSPPITVTAEEIVRLCAALTTTGELED
jgi:4-aminobutyrate aminotransferase-like enzyme